MDGPSEANNDRVDGRHLGQRERGRGGEEAAVAPEEVLRVELGAEVAAAVDDDGAPGDEGTAGRHAAATAAPGIDSFVMFHLIINHILPRFLPIQYYTNCT